MPDSESSGPSEKDGKKEEPEPDRCRSGSLKINAQIAPMLALIFAQNLQRANRPLRRSPSRGGRKYALF